MVRRVYGEDVPVARRVLALLVLLGVIWMVAAAAYSWNQQQFYVGDNDGRVTTFRGLYVDLPGVRL